MAGKVHGKQLKDVSIRVEKFDLSGAQGSYIYGTGSKLGTYDTSFNTYDYITKTYADSLSAGLDPKESVRLAATGSITLASPPATFDGVTASIGDRILIWQQTNNTENGIYIFNGTGSAMTRSSDQDGNPTSEISTGNYTFVTEGNTIQGNGYVVVATGTWSGVLDVGVAPIVWTQFTGAGSFTWGDGLSNTGNNIFVDLATNSGLAFTTGKLTIDSNIAGAGLAWNTGVLSVNTANGLTINGDNVEIASSAAGAGLDFNAGVFSVNTSNGLTVSGDNVQVAPSIAGSALTFNAGVIDVAVAYGVTFSGDALAADATTIKTTGYLPIVGSATGSSVQSALSSIDSYLSGLATDVITEVIAGAGLTGGGTTGSVTLNITSGNAGIVVNTDDITLTLGTGNDSSLSITGSGLVLNRTTLASNLDGSGISANAGVLNVNTANGLTVSGDNVQLDPSVAGNALTFNAGVIDVAVAYGVTFSGDALAADATTIKTTAYLPYVNTATNSSVQTALTNIDNMLSNIGSDFITGVTAGAGLVGGGSSGYVTLDIVSANAGITVSSDNIALTLGTGNDSSLSITGTGLVLNRTTLASNLDGSGISANAGVLNVNTANGLTVSGDNVQLDPSVAGNALTFNAGVIDVAVSYGVTFSGDALAADATTIKTTANLPTINVATGSSVQTALTAIDTRLSDLTAGQEISTYTNPTGTYLPNITTPVQINSGVTFSSLSDGVPAVYVNGIYYRPGSSTASAFFFSTDGVTVRDYVLVGDSLWSNVNAVTYRLDTSDEIVVEYMTKLV